MKRSKLFAAVLTLAILLTACSTATPTPSQSPSTPPKEETTLDAVEIKLSDNGITVNGSPAGTDPEANVYVGNDIIYYESGKDFTYGEGTEQDAHSPQAAAEHTVVHIARPGTYRISGSLAKGQIAVDLGDDAEEDPEAVVTLILSGADITCRVAPAIIFYNVYECGSGDADKASRDVDTSSAGANVIVADGTVNTVSGSYVARIYKPDSVVLNEAGTKVEDAKKLHKYDGAFYSKMSMNVSGGSENSGVLTINAENEGLDSELHLTINGGIIHINSGNDGINTNEDGVSVTTVNGGQLHIRVTGETGEGDGIDSNGWLVINGGIVTAQACSFSADAGIDSDMGIHINGGTVIATGHMLDRIEEGGQNYAVFTFAEKQTGSAPIRLEDGNGHSLFDTAFSNDYSILVYSSPDLTAGSYTLWRDGVQLSGQSGGMMGGPGMPGMPGMGPGGMPPEPGEGQMPNGGMPPESPGGMAPPEGGAPFEGQTPPDGWEAAPPDGWDAPPGGNPDDRQDGPRNPGNWNDGPKEDLTSEFRISDGGTMFQGVSPTQ